LADVEGRMLNREEMKNEICVPGVIRYIVTSVQQVYDLTLQRFNDLTWRRYSSFVIRHF
jgi:hypothetical protein